MSRKFESAHALRQALTDRLRAESTNTGQSFNTLLTKVLIERFLARLFSKPDAPWLLKGGYAFELRYRPKARTTRDVDVTVPGISGATLKARLEHVRDELSKAAELNLGDHMKFVIGPPKGDLSAPPLGGTTFPVEVRLADKVFGNFRVDVAFGDAIVGEPEELVGASSLAFAGIEPARVLAISKAQQFAEKLHAYTLPWDDRENTRVKDLVDLALLIERGELKPNEVQVAVATTFKTRARQPVPAKLPVPPASWTAEYAALATEAGIAVNTADAGFELLDRYWRSLCE